LRRVLGATLWAAALLIPCVGAAQTAVPTPSPTPSAGAGTTAVPPTSPPPSTSPQASVPSSAEATQGKPGGPAQVEKIVGIRVVGYQTVSPETIAHYLGVKVGDPYDPEKIRGNFQALWDVGLLENVAIEAEHSAAGVTLVVTIEERPTIKQVEFTGNKKFSNSQIKDRLKEEKVEIHEGAPLSLRDIAKTRSVIADYYAENGYRSATVDYRIEDISKTEKKVIFAVDEGDKIKIAAISF